MGDVLDRHETLQELLRRTRAVLFDFDGPVTKLFGDTSTAPVADRIKKMARAEWGPLDDDVEECDDSHDILRHLRDMYDRPSALPRDHRVLERAEAMVTECENEAVKKAEPVPCFEDLVPALRRLNHRLAVVSNNSDGPVWEFLKGVNLQSEFVTVVGRDPLELRHMKPDPYCVTQAVAHLRLPPSSCLLIGDQLTDLEAARRAGTRFLGYTGSESRAAEMRARGGSWVVRSHEPLLDAATALL
ncbi:HAD family hydrolase [Streptomyces sp. NPDC001443]